MNITRFNALIAVSWRGEESRRNLPPIQRYHESRRKLHFNQRAQTSILHLTDRS